MFSKIAHSANTANGEDKEKEGDVADAADAGTGNGTMAAGAAATMMQGGPKLASSIDYNMASTFARKPARTMEDGPTTKQKVKKLLLSYDSSNFRYISRTTDPISYSETIKSLLLTLTLF